MSKKNNKNTRRNAHEKEIEREKKGQEKRKHVMEKKDSRLAAKGIEKKKRIIGIRVRMGVTIKGIKVQDSETKRKVLKLLQAEHLSKASKTMDVEGGSKVKQAAKVASGVASLVALPKAKKKIRIARPGGKLAPKSPAFAPATSGAAAMEL